jgi:hypothetical protein
MSRLNPESLAWLDQVKTLQGELNSASRDETQKALNVSSSQVTNLLRLKVCFDAQALEKVRSASYVLSFKSALALAGLKKAKLADLSGAVHAALDLTLAHRLTTGQIKALVEWIKAGKPVTAFDPKAKLQKQKTSPTSPETEDEVDSDKPVPGRGFNPKNPRHVAEALMLLAFMFFCFWLAWKIVVWVFTWLIHLL